MICRLDVSGLELILIPVRTLLKSRLAVKTPEISQEKPGFASKMPVVFLQTGCRSSSIIDVTYSTTVIYMDRAVAFGADCVLGSTYVDVTFLGERSKFSTSGHGQRGRT